MLRSRRRSFPAVVAGALGVGGALALCPAALGDDAAGNQDLKEQIRLLESQVQQLEARRQQRPAAPQQPAPPPQAQEQAAPPASTQSSVGDALDAAERQAKPVSLAAEGFTAGYDNGRFIIQSGDGAFLLNPNVQLQARYVLNHRDNEQADGDDDTQMGFEIRRLKLALDGNVFSKDTVYHVQWNTSTSGGNVFLEEAFVRHAFGDRFWGGRLSNFAIKAGQFKDPVFHEEATDSRRQLAVDRSLLNETIGGRNTKYEQGVTLIYNPRRSPIGVPVRAEVGFIDGANTSNTNFTDSGGPAQLGITNPSWGVLARVDVKLAGDWRDYDDFSAMRTNDYLAVVGGGINITEGDGGTAYFHTVDVQWEPAPLVPGLSVYAAYVGLYEDLRADSGDVYHWGFLVQGAYMLSDQWEAFARYDYTSLDTGPGGAGTVAGGAAVTDSLHEFTVGVNYYLQGHASKFTADFTWLPNGSPLNQDQIGVLRSGDDDQFLIRLQYQLLL